MAGVQNLVLNYLWGVGFNSTAAFLLCIPAGLALPFYKEK